MNGRKQHRVERGLVTSDAQADAAFPKLEDKSVMSRAPQTLLKCDQAQHNHFLLV